MNVNNKIGIVRLGTSTGKEVILVDSNGTGAFLYIWASRVNSKRDAGLYFHNLIWSLVTSMGIPHGYYVAHRNGNTADNCFLNLELRREQRWLFPRVPTIQPERGLYYNVISAITFTKNLTMEYSKRSVHYYNEHNVNIPAQDCSHLYNECCYTPCVNMEITDSQFMFCKVCHLASYCSTECLQLDQCFHAYFCRPKPKSIYVQDTPER